MFVKIFAAAAGLPKISLPDALAGIIARPEYLTHFCYKELESGLKDKFGLLVLGAKHGHKDIEFNPQPRQRLRPGTILIVMGEVDNILKARDAF